MSDIHFSDMAPDGQVTRSRTISRSAILECPHVIMVADHYRADNTCRCDDPLHFEMIDWGYTWKGGRWV